MVDIPAALISRRSIGGFIANVTMEEQHTDKLTITRHPVEVGAAITDHAFKEPPSVVIRVGWSNSTFEAGGDPNYVADMYARLLRLQASRELLEVVTGKRAYEQMLVETLAVTTDDATEYALLVTATLQQIIVVETVVTAVAPREAQAEPQKTSSTVDVGTRQVAPAKEANVSALKQAYGAMFQ